jgi:heat shock protein HspQ
MIKDDTKRVVSYVSKDIYNKLKKESKYEDRTISKMIEKILKDHYKIKDEE